MFSRVLRGCSAGGSGEGLEVDDLDPRHRALHADHARGNNSALYVVITVYYRLLCIYYGAELYELKLSWVETIHAKSSSFTGISGALGEKAQ